MTVTLKDVAAEAGVAISTVSLVLNGRGEELKLSSACIARVQATAEKLGYRSNYHARTLKSGCSRTIGVVKADDGSSFLAQLFWSTITAGIDIAARARGYNLLLLGAASNQEPLVSTRQAMDERRIDALIALHSTAPLPQEIARHAIPTVLIGGRPVRGLSRISFDPKPGLSACIDHLHGLGHRTVLALGAARDGKVETPERTAIIVQSARERQLALESQVVEVGQSVDDVAEIIARHRQALLPLLPLPRAVTAVLCWNDTMALSLVSLLKERGVRVPQDVSVIGFDDMRATHVVPPLTTVSHALLEQGRTAVELALEQLEPGVRAKARSVAIAARLVVRSSTAAPARD